MLRTFFDILIYTGFLQTALGMAVSALVIAAAATLASMLASRDRAFLILTFGLILGVSFAAQTVGFVAGNSRTGVIGTVLPITLSGLGALLSYALIERKVRPAIALAGAVTFCLSLMLGLFVGADYRAAGLNDFVVEQMPPDLFDDTPTLLDENGNPVPEGDQ